MIEAGHEFELLAVCTNGGGIGKEPRLGPVRVDFDGLDADQQANLKHHGGPDQAICLYADEDYEAFANAGLAPRLGPGAFGENFATRGIDWSDAALGQRFTGRESGLIFEVTCFRVPCRNLSALSPKFPHVLVEQERTGSYARVIEPADVSVGEVFEAEAAPSPAVTLRQHQRVVLGAAKNPDPTARRSELEQVLAQPALAARARDLLEASLRRLG